MGVDNILNAVYLKNYAKVFECRHFGLSTFRSVDVSVCGCFGLSMVDDLVCQRFRLSTFWVVNVSVCRRVGLSMFWFVDILVCWRFGSLTFGCQRFGLSTFWLVTHRRAQWANDQCNCTSKKPREFQKTKDGWWNYSIHKTWVPNKILLSLHLYGPSEIHRTLDGEINKWFSYSIHKSDGQMERLQDIQMEGQLEGWVEGWTGGDYWGPLYLIFGKMGDRISGGIGNRKKPSNNHEYCSLID